jgi:hypothetical protein
MSVSRPTTAPPFARWAALVAVLAIGVVAAGCSGSGGPGSAPTTTAAPLSARDMCTLGQNIFQDVDALDRSKPEYLDQVKKAVKPLADRAPADIADDTRAWVAYVQSATSAAQLASMPADLRVSTNRIDAWWKQNCGKPLIGS